MNATQKALDENMKNHWSREGSREGSRDGFGFGEEDEEQLASKVWTKAPLAFVLTGASSIDDPSQRCQVLRSAGTVSHVDATSLTLERPDAPVILGHNLPSTIDLRSLLGQSLEVTLVEDFSPGYVGPSQTLSLAAPTGSVWLIARCGPVHGAVHSIGRSEVRAALSQRPGGPLVVGTSELQWLVQAGCHVRLGGRAAGLVALHIARVSTESAAYLIAESAIYKR
jgi:hypothetical protein